MIAKFNIKWLFICAITLMILLFISIFVNFILIRKPDKLGTIDVQRIITHEAQKLASTYPKGDVPPEKLSVLIESIQGNIQKISQEKKVILLSRSAVLSGDIPDYTEIFIGELEDELSKQDR